jgi:hypothetical protein
LEIITRAEAKARGLKRFFTGEPCKHGHVAERLVSSRGCMECTRERNREKRANDPEYVERERARERERYANDLEWVERRRERQREKYANDPEFAERQREYQREKRANDPEYAERGRERMRKRYHEKYANDPEYIERNRERAREYGREKRANDPEYVERERERMREWQRNNPEKNNARQSRRRARKLDALPADRAAETAAYEAQLRAFQQQYAAQGLEVHVDHWVPLSRGGLHVPENLRLIPADHNRRKNDRLDSELDFELHVLLSD